MTYHETLSTLNFRDLYQSCEEELSLAAYQLAVLGNMAHGYAHPVPTALDIAVALSRLCGALELPRPKLRAVLFELRSVFGLEVVA